MSVQCSAAGGRALVLAVALLALAACGEAGGSAAEETGDELPQKEAGDSGEAALVEAQQDAGDSNPPTGKTSGGAALIYHHVGEDTPPSTSVTPERFREHLDYLEDNDFNVWALPRLIETARAGGEIPPRTVAITFDDAYSSVYDEAFPLLAERDWPFTVFVPTEAIGGHDIYSDWDELREMEDAGATIANHSVNHPHMARARLDEDEDDWLERMEAEIVEAQAMLEQQLDDPARVFAWPYGESSPPVRELLRDHGFAGVGQQSGAIGPVNHDFTALPRFPIATGFDSLESFAQKTHTRPLPVTATEPAGGVLAADAGRPELELTLVEGAYRPGSVNCFSGGEPIAVERIADEPLRLRVRAEEKLPVGRTNYTCTAPATDGDYFLWFSFLWMKPQSDGHWYSD